MNSYELSRQIFDWGFENPEKITPTHIALYFFCIEHCNRLGWKKKFGLPTTMAKEAIGIKSYNTYIKTLNDLVDWGFITMIEKSKNQYSSNIIALSKFDKATNKALDKALIKHTTKQSESTEQSIDSINKQETNKPKTNKQVNLAPVFLTFRDELFQKWIDYRKEIKKPLKATSIESLKKTWESKSDSELEAIINQSISNGWQGLFELKQGNKQLQHYADDKPIDTSKPMKAYEAEKLLFSGKLNT